MNGMLSTALGNLKQKGLFLQGQFKLSFFQQGGDTGSAPRELWVRLKRKWSEEVDQRNKTPFLLSLATQLLLTIEIRSQCPPLSFILLISQ